MADAVTFFKSYYEGIQQVPEEYRLEAYEAIMKYVFDGIEPSEDASPWAQIIFRMAKPTLDNGLTNRSNGKKGGAPKGNANAKKREDAAEEETTEAETTEETTETTQKTTQKTTKTTPLVLENNRGLNEKTSKSNVMYSNVKECNVKELVKELKDSCTEPTAAPVISMPLNDGTEFPVTEEMVKEWGELYPAVDVMQQLRNARGWLVDNPTRRKTKSGIGRYLHNWLAKEQNRGRAAPYRAEKEVREYQREQRDLNFLMEG